MNPIEGIEESRDAEKRYSCTTAKNEGPYIWEWVAYHRIVGFEEIIMFQNDSDDGTHEIMSALRDAGIIRYLYNRADPGKHQIRAYWRAARQPEYKKADWVMALDMDEFLVIQAGNGTVSSLINALPDDADCAFICWKRFGAGLQKEISNGLVTDRFTLCEKDDWVATHPIPFKSLFRRERYQRPGIHKPLHLVDDQTKLVNVNGSGLYEHEFTLKNYQCTDPLVRKLAQINHYITRDPQSFTLKSHKGSAHQANRSVDEAYWKNRNKNQMEDQKIRKTRVHLCTEMKRMDFATGGKLSELTTQAVARHRAQFTEVVKEAEMETLYEFCRNNPQVPARLRHKSVDD